MVYGCKDIYIYVYTCLYMFIPPIKMVMPGGWFYGIVLPTLVRFKPQEFWDFMRKSDQIAPRQKQFDPRLMEILSRQI